MTDFNELVKHINGGAPHEPRLSREQQLEILAAMNKPDPQISWTQRDLDETLAHVFSHVDGGFKNLLAAVGRYVKAQIEPLHRRIDELQAKQANWKYRGTFETGADYREGNFTTFQGSLWVCLADTFSEPGTDATWQLCCKRGKNAR